MSRKADRRTAGMKAFLEQLSRRVLLCDGGMGTMLYAKGIYINTCFDELNLTGAGLVREVHAEYVKAGVDIIETNTFGANRFKLKKYGLDDKVGANNRAGVDIAREAAGADILVAGSRGPLGVSVEPWGPTSAVAPESGFAEA